MTFLWCITVECWLKECRFLLQGSIQQPALRKGSRGSSTALQYDLVSGQTLLLFFHILCGWQLAATWYTLNDFFASIVSCPWMSKFLERFVLTKSAVSLVTKRAVLTLVGCWDSDPGIWEIPIYVDLHQWDCPYAHHPLSLRPVSDLLHLLVCPCQWRWSLVIGRLINLFWFWRTDFQFI